MFYLNIKVLFISLFLLIGFSWADVSGYVYKDDACGVYGVRESDEVGISGATIRVVDSEGNSEEINTDDNGSWNSSLNAPVRVELISYDSESLKESPYGLNSKTDTQLISENSDEIEFGLYNESESCGKKGGGLGDKEAIEVGNLVWSDNNFNGIQDAGESGIEGVVVNLYCDGELISSATTDSQGYYIFSSDSTKNSTDSYKYNIDKLVEGNTNNCKIVIEKQELICDLNATKPNQGDNRAIDSNGVLDGDRVIINIPDTIESGDNNHTLDVGFAPCICIGDFIWLDENKNGIQDANESGLPNITVNLLNEDGEVVDTTSTNSEGIYVFCNLHAGQKYHIQVVKPNENYGFSPKEQGSDESKDSNLNSDGKSDLITIGECDDTIDGGLIDNTPQTVCIGDFIWLDENKNGIQDANESGLSNITVNLLNEDGEVVKSATTNSDGKYQFCGLLKGQKYYIQVIKPNENYGFSPKGQGDDDSKDSDLNSDGKSDLITIGDSNDNTIDGGLVDNTPQTVCIGDFIWLDENKNGIQDANESGLPNITVNLLNEDGEVVKSATTNSDGKYQFCGLHEGEKYYIQVVKPKDYKFTQKDTGNNDTKDSDVDENSGKTTIITVTNQDDTSWDAGLIPNENVGGEDRNGTACLGNYMWLDENLNGQQDSGESGVVGIKVELYDANNTLLATTQTDSSGKYEFCNLKAGKYKVKFEQPSSYLFTLQNRGDDTKDSDVDSNGWSDVVELKVGSNNLTVDAGVYCECDDYLANPDEYKEVSAEISISSMLLTLLFTVLIALLLRRKRG